jgi:hypothetical protein
MENLVLIRYYGDEVCSGRIQIPFKYISKEQFLLDIIEDFSILKKFETWYDSEFENKNAEYFLDELEIYTLEEWFLKNEINL